MVINNQYEATLHHHDPLISSYYCSPTMVSPHLSSPTSYQLVHARCRCRVHPCIWRTRRFHPTGAHFSTCIPPTDQWTWTHRGWEYRSCHLHSSDPLRSSGCALWISPPKLISMQTGFQSPPQTTDNPPGQNLEWSRAGQLDWAFFVVVFT